MEGTIKQELDEQQQQELQQQQQQQLDAQQPQQIQEPMNTSINNGNVTEATGDNSQNAFDQDQDIINESHDGNAANMSQGGEFDDCPQGGTVAPENTGANGQINTSQGSDAQTGNAADPNANITEPEQFRKVFIGGLSYKTDDETLKAYFGKYGELVDYVVMKDSQTGRSRGFGFVTYADSHMVDELMKNRPHIIDGRQVEPKRATPREDSGKAEVQMTVKKLFIGGLRDTITEDDLKAYFNQYGSVVEAVIMKEKESSKSRGFGFVTFDDYDPVDKIILEKHHTINGVNVHTQKALPKDFEKGPSGKPQESSRSGKGGYGGGGGGYGGHGGHHGGSGGHHGGHHGGSGGHHNQNMPNINNLAQMAATFFAAAAANKGMGGSGGGGGGHKGGAGMMNTSQIPGGNRNPYNDFSYNANSANAPMPGGKMGHMMNQMMGGGNTRQSGMGGGGGGGGGMPMGKMGGGPGPMRGGHGRFSSRSGPYSSGHGGYGGNPRGGRMGGRGGGRGGMGGGNRGYNAGQSQGGPGAPNMSAGNMPTQMN